MTYEDMDAVELRHELDDWTARSIQWADDVANAVEAQDIIRAAFITHAYRQARMQMRRIKRCLEIGVA
jgi:hypothetical protein